MNIINLKNFKEYDFFEDFSNWLQKDINQVNKIILETLETDSSLVTDLSSHIIQAGWKKNKTLINTSNFKTVRILRKKTFIIGICN